MHTIKAEILQRLCYTPLVYERINKKLNARLSNSEIEAYIRCVLEQTSAENFCKTGKNYYARNSENNIIVCINSNTFRVITVDRITKKVNE
ncbi:MAG: DUF3781 domain-containing protein [Bacteroidia bacterium]|nr:DUF3781 domain-containing protein [Bacteroidia bacterium]